MELVTTSELVIQLTKNKKKSVNFLIVLFIMIHIGVILYNWSCELIA